MGLNTQRTRGTFILFGVFHALTRCVPWLRTLRWLYQPHGSVTGDGDGASMSLRSGAGAGGGPCLCQSRRCV